MLHELFLGVRKHVHLGPNGISMLIQDFFQEIGIVFQPSHYSSTEATLEVKAKEVGIRMSSHAGNLLLEQAVDYKSRKWSEVSK